MNWLEQNMSSEYWSKQNMSAKSIVQDAEEVYDFLTNWWQNCICFDNCCFDNDSEITHKISTKSSTHKSPIRQIDDNNDNSTKSSLNKNPDRQQIDNFQYTKNLNPFDMDQNNATLSNPTMVSSYKSYKTNGFPLVFPNSSKPIVIPPVQKISKSPDLKMSKLPPNFYELCGTLGYNPTAFQQVFHENRCDIDSALNAMKEKVILAFNQGSSLQSIWKFPLVTRTGIKIFS